MNRFKGHIQSKEDKRDLPIGILLQKFRSTSPMLGTDSLSPFKGNINDQTITSSCVAQSGTKTIFIRARALGFNIPELSVMASYDFTRGLDLGPGDNLLDEGAMPRSFYKGAQKWGVVASSRWPFDEGKINDTVPFDVLEAGYEARVTSYHGIFETGLARCQRIREAINAKAPVMFAMPVDKAYEQLDSLEVYQERRGDILGGHAQCAIGYGPGYFEVLGSWGIGFGAGGIVRIGSAYMGSSEVTDLWVPDVVPMRVQ